MDSLDFANIDAVGFDVDHTLAKYNLHVAFDVIHSAFTKFLVEQRDWDEKLSEPLLADREFCSVGIVADNFRGNFLRIGQNGQIIRAYHGRRLMTPKQISDIYGEKWRETDILFNNVTNMLDREYSIFDNYFDSIGMAAYGRMIDLADEKVKENGGELTSYKHIWNDLMAAFHHVYIYEAFARDAGGFFPLYKCETEKFVEVLSDEFKSWLRSLRANGKVVFAMTSSNFDFGSHTLNFILGSDWKSYFDVILTRAKKPSFFICDRKFNLVECINNKYSEKEVDEIDNGNIYTEGNLKDFMKYLTLNLQKAEPKVLYVGDSLRSDIFPSKTFAKWKTLMIRKELKNDKSSKFDDTSDPKSWSSFENDQSNPYLNVKPLWDCMIDNYADGVIDDVIEMMQFALN